MKFACDFDIFRAWGDAVANKRFERPVERGYNVATIYKRAQGSGTIRAIQGLDDIGRRFGQHVVWNTLQPIGSRRRDWRATLVSDGFIMLRHPDLKTTLAMADEVGTKVQLYAQ